MSTYAQNQNGQIQNTNRWSTKQLVTMALMCAIAILLSFLEFPIFPAASFLKLDISFVPSAVMGFAYGTGPGILVGVACAVVHGAITGNWVGCLMNIIACCAFIIPAAAIYKRNRNWAQKLNVMMPERAMLVCVGAGHLPGDKGLLQLLRNMGYTVEPAK